MLRVSTNAFFRTGELNIVSRQRELLDAQTRLSSGKRINTPDDDPLGAADVASIRSSLSQFDQFKQNQDHARYLLNLGESALEGFVAAVQDVQEKLVAAGNASFGQGERLIIARDLEGVLERMVGMANSADGTGGYLFAGAKENVQPFTQNVNAVSFRGDDILQRLEVSNDRFQQVKYSGDALFLKMRAGNGTFTTAAAATNTGTAVLDTGSVLNPAQLTGRPYTVSFTVAAGVTTYNVVRTNADATTTVVSTGTYTSPVDLQFDGIRVTLSGDPAATDTFSIAPSGFQSVFDTVAQAIALLKNPVATPQSRAIYQTTLGAVQASMAQAQDHILLKRADIGTALQELDAYAVLNDDRQLEYQTRLSATEDLDYAKGASDLARRQSNFEAALSSYSRISKLSLFDYL
jgi:flagellar hook-associated protein 3 FlgL